jgi:hypothetical protein
MRRPVRPCVSLTDAADVDKLPTSTSKWRRKLMTQFRRDFPIHRERDGQAIFNALGARVLDALLHGSTPLDAADTVLLKKSKYVIVCVTLLRTHEVRVLGRH